MELVEIVTTNQQSKPAANHKTAFSAKPTGSRIRDAYPSSNLKTVKMQKILIHPPLLQSIAHPRA
jgi:hypothetical protein